MRARNLLLLLLLFPLLSCGGCKKRQQPGSAPPPPGPAPRPAEAPRQLPALRPPPHRPDTLLGGELGLDHAAIAVRDLGAATESYRKLGFGSPSPGKLPNGIQNVNYYFKDTTYLETMSAWDDKKAAWLADFTRKHEGAYFLALCVHSAEETAAFLASRGFETHPPRPGRIGPPGAATPAREMWKTLFFKRSPFPRGSFFFIAYDRQVRQSLFDRLSSRPIRRRYFSHPNTAQGIRAVWMAVKSAETTARSFQAIGLPPGRSVEHAALGARGRLVPAGIGSILVLEPSHPAGKLAAFLAARGEGLIGLSIHVRHLDMARMRIQQNTARSIAPTPGFFGQALLLPPEMTHGAWMELTP